MKKLLLILCLFSQHLQAQEDTLVKNEVYTCLYSFTLKAPIYVAYKLYQGGGDCSRKNDSFKGIPGKTAIDKDYDFHYDKGHVCPAEDFAYDCSKEKLTFSYFNCFPQTVALNRGKWKSVETTVRAMSQKDSLLIVAGGMYSVTKIGWNVTVPDICWKVVYSLSLKKVIISKTFQNNSNPDMVDLDFDKLRFMLWSAYKIDLLEIINGQ